MTSVMAVPFLLAASSGGTANQPSGQGQEFGSSGPVALILTILLFIAIAFLIRSMTRHLKKVPASFDPVDENETQAETEQPTDGDTPTAERTKQDH
jgi:hypothetical protein